jgi:hypothetical protein
MSPLKGPTGNDLYMDRTCKIIILDDDSFIMQTTQAGIEDTIQGARQIIRQRGCRDRAELIERIHQWLNVQSPLSLTGDDDSVVLRGPGAIQTAPMPGVPDDLKDLKDLKDPD